MNFIRSKIVSRCFFFLLISAFCILFWYIDHISKAGWFGFLAVLGGLVIATAIVVGVKTTIVTWITLLVLLAFSGKRRRVLVVERKKITVDVAMFLVRVVLKEKRVVAAVACATTILSSMAAMMFLKEG